MPYRTFQHRIPPKSLEEAAEARGQDPSQIVRSILFHCDSGEFVLVLMAGPGQISWPKLRARLGVSRLRMARPPEVREVTGSVIGAVTPLGLPRPLRVLADNSVFRHDEISIGSGERGTAILMKTADLHEALDLLEIGHFAEE